MVNKELIKQRFKKSFTDYEKNAVIQNYMSTMLLSELLEIKNEFNKIFEIGCGIGILTKKLSLLTFFNELFVNDLIENCLGEIKINSEKIRKLYGDCEKIPFPQDLDLVISSATFQWLENLPAVLNKIHSSLNKGGILAFSTFEEENLYQIRAITGKSLGYYKKEELEKILQKNFKIIYSNTETMNLEFDSVHDILNHLKSTGVNSLSTSNWTKSDLKEFKEKYNKLFKDYDGKLVLTYKPVWFICVKIDDEA